MTMLLAALAWLNANAGAILGIALTICVTFSVLVTLFSIIAKMTPTTADDAIVDRVNSIWAKVRPWVDAMALNTKGATTGAQVLDKVAQVVEQKLVEHGQAQAAAVTTAVAATMESALAKAQVVAPSSTLQQVADVADKVAGAAHMVEGAIGTAANSAPPLEPAQSLTPGA